MRPVRGAARAMLSTIFVVSGARSVVNPEPFLARARTVTDRVGPLMEKTGLPLPSDAGALVRLNGATQVVAGVLLATGHLTRPAAVVLAGTLVPTTVAGHPFWSTDDPVQRAAHRTQFIKNLGLFGGLLLAAVDTEGRPGLRWRTGHAVSDGRRSMRRMVHGARREARSAVRAATPGLVRRR